MASLIEAGTKTNGAGQAMVVSRAATEAQAAMFLAKNFPRDTDSCVERVVQACKRRFLAEVCQYEYPKGGSMVRGPSIRLIEVIAQCWGNVDFGFVELERSVGRDGVGFSVVQAYAVDLEHNVRRVTQCTVRHWRDDKGRGHAVTSEREIYELVANYAQRRVRMCLSAILPNDVVEMAVSECMKTLETTIPDTPLGKRVERMVEMYEHYGVKVSDIEKQIGHNLQAITETELSKLGRIYVSIRDGVAPADKYFASMKKKSTGKNGTANKNDVNSLFEDSEAAGDSQESESTDDDLDMLV